ncbi:MAG: beta-lactamase family protein [Ignavibacteriae bacterium]|nr:beta-lactamase family protein [Ignavibacteriota bacterium]
MKNAIYTFLSLFLTLNTLYNQNDFSIKANEIGVLFIEGINNPSSESKKEIVSQVFSEKLITEKGIDAMVNLFNTLQSTYSPLDYHHSEINQFNKPSGIVYVMHIYAKKKGDVMWQDFQLYMDNTQTYKINSLAFIAEVAEPINLPNGTIEQDETIKWLNNYITKLQSDNDLSGSILIAKGNKVLFERYFGYSDLEKTLPIDKNSLFGIASGGKMFTALCIAKLVEENKINYNDKITKYIEGFADKTKANKITIHHLLTHTSGVEQYWWGQKSNAFYKAKSIDDHLKMVLEAGLKNDSGMEYEYNNSNYILLGAILEKVSGMDYFTFVKKNILDKANMVNSGFFYANHPNIVTRLKRNEEGNQWIKLESGTGRGSSAGGVYSNAFDMLNFSEALRTNRIVSSVSFQKMITIHNKGYDTTENYGYGFIIQTFDNEKTYGHGGTAKGVNFEFRYFPKQEITFIVFSNQDNGAYDDLKRNTIKLISGKR